MPIPCLGLVAHDSRGIELQDRVWQLTVSLSDMHIAFLNPQGNFDVSDSYWTEHPDFGGQLVYVKNVAIAMAQQGHSVDIVTRQIVDPSWPEFAAPLDGYAGIDGVRIIRIPCGPAEFVRKEALWPHIDEWVQNLAAFYGDGLPDATTGHYGDGGLASALFETRHGVPFTFTAHSLGAQKLAKLQSAGNSLEALDGQYLFRRRLMAERAAIANAGTIITSTNQERQEQYGDLAYADVASHGRFAVVPPGVALDVFDLETTGPSDAKAATLVESRIATLPENRRQLPCVIASSRLDPKKNVTGIVEAFAANPRLAEISNLIILTGALTNPLEDASTATATERAVLDDITTVITNGGLEDSVLAFGLRGQPMLAGAYRHLTRRRSVFALTALYEPFGLAPLEAAAAGLAVVATQNGGPSESFDNGTYGVLVDPTDANDIARGLITALDQWDRFSVAGRQRVHDRYTWDRTAAGYVTAIHDAAGRSGEAAIHPYFTGGEDVSADQLAELLS